MRRELSLVLALLAASAVGRGTKLSSGQLGESGDSDRWVWERVPVTSPAALPDRAAFSGDRCATGRVHVQGACVEPD